MIFACQKDSYLKEFTTKVLSCTPVVQDQNTGEISHYEVILEDTVLFPESGGQPDDRGTLNGTDVFAIQKRNGQAVHLMKSPVPVGEVADLCVNWIRRFEHMQQHSGQHLISAMAETMFNFHTLSWHLGADESFIELDTPSVSIYEMEYLEKMINEIIRSSVPITVHYYEKGDPELAMVRIRLDLPEDHDDPVRVVKIQGIDKNTCCGTHVKNTSELQIIKLLYTEKAKRNRTNLYFLVGERILRYISKSVCREKKQTELLGCCADEHHVLVEHLQNSLKLANKNAQTAIRDVASLEAKLFNLKNPVPAYFSLHRKNAEPDFISVFLNEAKSDGTLFFLTVGDPKTGGHMVMFGPLPLVEKYGPQVCNILEGKGTTKKGKFQGKVKKLSKIPEAEKLLVSVHEETVSHLP